MRWLRPVQVMVVLLLVAAAFAVGRWGDRVLRVQASSSPQAQPGEEVLVRFDGGALTTAEFLRRLQAVPAAERAQFTSPEGRQRFLELQLRTELFARAAARLGLDEDPELVLSVRRTLAQRYMEWELRRQDPGAVITEGELTRYYQEHLDAFVRPARARGFLLVLRAPAGDAAQRRRKREFALGLLKEARAREQQDPRGFQRLVREKSEDPVGRAADGDTGLFPREELARRFGAPVADALFASPLPGIGELVDTGDAFVLVKRAHHEPALQVPFEEAREVIRSRLAQQLRARRMEQRLAELRTELNAQVEQSLLESLKLGGESIVAH